MLLLLIFVSSFITFSLPYILVLSFPLPSSFLPSSFSYLILRSFFSFINRTCKPFNYTSTTNFAIRMNPLVKKEHSQHRHRENMQSRYLVSLIAVSSDTYKFFGDIGILDSAYCASPSSSRRTAHTTSPYYKSPSSAHHRSKRIEVP